MEMAVRFKYTGQAAEYLPGIPARDLDDDDLALLSEQQRAEVAVSRLYEAAKIAKPEQEG